MTKSSDSNWEESAEGASSFIPEQLKHCISFPNECSGILDKIEKAEDSVKHFK